MKAQSLLETVGRTPHIRLNKIFPNNEVWIKDERRNPSGSIKDRAALAMIEDAEQSGILKSGSVIVEPTSGNTGIGLAMIAAIKNYIYFYNYERRQKKLNKMSPMTYRQLLENAA